MLLVGIALIHISHHNLSTFSDWNEYFPGTKPTKTHINESHINNGFAEREKESFYISNCYFSDTIGVGVYIDVYDEGVQCLIEYCMFISCYGAYTYGGAINYYGQNSEFIMHHVCGINCSTFYQGCFIYAKVDGDFILENRNYLLDSSITKSIGDGKEYTICLEAGSVHFERINSTQHKTKQYPAISLNPSPKDPFIGYAKYSSFCNNTAFGSMVVVIFQNSIIDNCNILHNIQQSQLYIEFMCDTKHM